MGELEEPNEGDEVAGGRVHALCVLTAPQRQRLRERIQQLDDRVDLFRLEV